MSRSLGIGIFLAFLFASPVVATEPDRLARTPFDIRVNALSTHALLTRAPQFLVDPARQRAARTVTDLRQGVFFVWAGAQIYAFAWFWRSGRAAQVRDALRRRLTSRINLRAGFGATLGVLGSLAGLPFAFIHYRIGFNVGLSEERIGAWLLDYIGRTFVDASVTALAVAVVLELVDRTRLWYLAFIAALFSVTLTVVAVDPVVFTPVFTQTTRLPIAAAAPVELTNASRHTQMLTARTAGIGGFTRIFLGDVFKGAATPREVTYAVAFEEAHVRHNDVLKETLVATTMCIFGVAIALLISDRIGFRRDDDAVSRLALVAAFFGGVALVLFPLYNAYARGIDYRADEDARRLLKDPAPAVRLLVRRADHDLVPLCYRRSSSWYFAAQPALGSRIAEMRGSPDPCPHSPVTR